MTPTPDPERDLTIQRIIKAPRAAVWRAWADPANFAQWWLPAPLRCQVEAMDMRPGGAFVTLMSEDGAPFGPHVSGCFLDIVEGERIVFTNALLGGWRPSGQAFMTAIITMADHADGTDYRALAMHKDQADRDMHDKLGFYDGWGTVIGQLAALVERA